MNRVSFHTLIANSKVQRYKTLNKQIISDSSQKIYTSNPEVAPQYRAASWRRFVAPTSFDSSRTAISPTSNIYNLVKSYILTCPLKENQYSLRSKHTFIGLGWSLFCPTIFNKPGIRVVRTAYSKYPFKAKNTWLLLNSRATWLLEI